MEWKERGRESKYTVSLMIWKINFVRREEMREDRRRMRERVIK